VALKVLRAGILSTLQDLGRWGCQRYGVPVSGVMDEVSHRLANLLVGNDENEATVEMTLVGPGFALTRDALIALCGGDFEPRINGERLPRARPVLARAGSTLDFGVCRRGCRAYLAVAGGFAVEPVLGSRSTYLPAQFGGLGGRALRAGDFLPLAADSAALACERAERLQLQEIPGAALRSTPWSAPSLTLPEGEFTVIHAMAGRHFGWFDAASQLAFFDAPWRVSSDSNRMGLRLLGPALARVNRNEILSEPTCLGTVQVPADGAPIALMADHQTTGGYPKIAEIAGADVPRLAQLVPGAAARFARCTLAEALELRRAARERFESARRGIEWKYES
jgi:antagonist of KipI